MKKMTVIPAAVLSGICVGCASAAPGHVPPPAAEQSADHARVVDVAHAALAAISREDMVAFTDLMIDEAIVVPLSQRNGVDRYRVRTRDQERRNVLNVDIVERGFDPTVHVSGPVAHVWMPYDIYIDGRWSHCGVDAFTMVRADGSWRIASLAYTVEQPPQCRPHPHGPPAPGLTGR